MSRGLVIALDGPDGVGKTTQLDLLHAYLKKQGYSVHVTRASGGTPIGEELRKVSLSGHDRPPETDVFISLAMFAALAHDIHPHREHGEIILIDRSPIAMAAYNAYGGQLPDTETIQLVPGKQRILEACVDTCEAWTIDLLMFLDAPQDALNGRRQKRQTNDYFENQDRAYHDRVREGYYKTLEYLESSSAFSSHIAKVDAKPDIETIHSSITQIIEKHLPDRKES